jgi:putative ABC transport system permease protein
VPIRPLLKALLRNSSGPLLVSAQVAITLAVLVNVLYSVQQDVADINRPTGLDLDNMFWLSTEPTGSDYNYESATKADLIYLNALPQVVAASTVNNLPQGGGSTGLLFAPNAEDLQRPGGGSSGYIYFGTEKFLDTLGLKLIAGRNFSPEEIKPPLTDGNAALSDWASEVIITKALADKIYPDGDALGKPLYASLINKTATIVGIVGFMQARATSARFEEYVERVVIVPMIAPGPDAAYIVRTKPGQRAALMAQIEQNFAALQPGRFLYWIESYSVTANDARQGMRASAIISAVVAVCVLAVTIVGISGLAAFNVTKRTKQLGIRRAIGASKPRILYFVLLENWIVTSFGTFLGCILALIAGMKLSSLYDMPRFPLYYLVGGVLLLWIVGLLAVLVPARRAASITPAVATRSV